MKHLLTKTSTLILAIAIGLIASATALAQANVVIQDTDTAGMGFKDTTPAAPVGGNNGTTVGQQRLIVFQTAASIWGATLTSSQTITITASWADLQCSANSGVLGHAGPTNISSGFANAVPNRWYPVALAEALSNANRNATSAEINAQFNQKLGQAGCLSSAHWYYGLDNNHGSDGIDLLTVVLHELGHGLGFLTFTDPSTGTFAGTGLSQFPSIWDDFLFDDTAGKSWAQMTTDQERAASAINTGKLVWIGPQVLGDVPTVLSGTPRLRANSPASIGGYYQVFTADFGPAVSGETTANVVQALDPADGAGPSTTDGCSALTNPSAISGKIAFIDRGTCTFITKTRNAQNAGAVAVIIADNAGNPNGPLTGLGGGPDNTITIPAVGISVADGNTIRAQLASPGVNASLLSDLSQLAGTDAQGRPLMFTPNPVQGGSSVSHWDTSLFRNQLMEPSNSSDLTHSVSAPQDLTLSLLKDIGWKSVPGAAPTILLEQGTANAASAIDSVTFVRGPFSIATANNFSADGRRRLLIFTTDLGFTQPTQPNSSTLSVQIGGIPGTVESAGPFNAVAGTSYVVVRLPDGLSTGQTYAVTVTLRGVNSTNAPTITIQ
jgi:hypothetical protein